MRTRNLKLILLMSLSLQLTSFSLFSRSRSLTVYDFDDTIISTTSEIVLFQAGADPKTARQDQILTVDSANWAEARHQIGKPGPYQNFVLQPGYSFRNFARNPQQNGFLELVKETLTLRPPKQWQAPKWGEFAERMSQPETAKDVFILTARSARSEQILEAFQF
jgi:hypothetical protein